MNPSHYLFVDERLLGMCVFCGGKPDTREHVPSKVLLDDPLPENLSIVDSCGQCNQSFSLDEEYLACFLGCVLAGSTSSERMLRPKVKKALEHNPKIAARIQATRSATEDGSSVWTPELDRVKRVIVKLARGHSAYELSQIQLDEPSTVTVAPLPTMSVETLEEFERAGVGEMRGWPEIGSRAFLRASGAPSFDDAPAGPWICVQRGQYRYSVDEYGGVRVQMVIGEYLGCVVDWGS
ncbi:MULTISPECIES: hypothetical protein [Acidobacteriaceae]|uniref:hypothetical protein n=1 Tax=Acidobacteriaceae TaxID=204434 RepID=UPI001576307D|nr:MULTISPECIES: hypothetical protein [Acidobacteriaceae]MDW5265361.1 hypothetical protein [Edaphobacter sp.]